jgi:hypothetical protein
LGFGDGREKSKRRDIVFALLIDGFVMKTKYKGISLLYWTIRMLARYGFSFFKLFLVLVFSQSVKRLANFWVWYGFCF